MANDKDIGIILGADIPKSTVQIEADLKKIKPENLKVGIELDLDHVDKLKEQLEKIAKEQEKLQGYTKSKVNIKTTNTGAIDSASIKYYNELTKETVTQLYTIDKETGNLALKTKDLTTNYQAQAKSEAIINKQRLDFINNQSISLDKLKSSYSDSNALKSLDGDNLTQLNSVYDGIIAKTEQLKTVDKTRSEELQREIKAERATYEQLIKSKQNAQYVATSLRTKDVSTINSEEVNNLRKFEAQIQNSRVGTNAMESDLKDLHTTLATAFDKDSLTGYLNQLSVAKSKFSALKEEAKIKTVDDSSNLQNQVKYYDRIKQELSNIQKLKKQLTNAGAEESVEINRQITNSQKRISYDEQQIEKKKLYNQELFKEVNELKLIQEAQNKISSAKQNDKANSDYQKQANSIEQIGLKAQIGANRVKAFGNQLNSTARGKYADELKSLENAFKNIGGKEDLTKANAQLREFETRMRSMGNVGNTVFDKLKKNIGQFFSFIGAASISMTVINSLRKAVSNVVELDTAMVELRKVTDETESAYVNFYNQANKIAKVLGASTKDVISATASWAQMGYTIKEATELAKSSEILKNISENMDISQATSTLVSSIKAFKLNVNDTLDGVVSKINQVGNEFAVTNSDVANILQRSSSAMADANNTMEETIALGTAATEITRNADETGTALKTMSMRIRGMNEDTGEADDSLKDLSKSIKGLTGVSIFTDETNQTYKSTYKILQEVSKVYGSLSDKSQAQVLELIAGNKNALYVQKCA